MSKPPTAPDRPHIYTGPPRYAYCPRCRQMIDRAGKECKGEDRPTILTLES